MTPREVEMLRRVVRERALAGRHLEIGTAAGGTLCEMMKAAPKQPPFVVVDPMKYFADQRATVERNLTQHGLRVANVEFRELRSAEALLAARAAKESFDFVLIDGGHKLRNVAQDLGWAALVNVGGIIAVHDYRPFTRGVMWALDYFLRKNRNYRRVEQVDSLVARARCPPRWRSRFNRSCNWSAACASASELQQEKL
jgi:predicted O-methyltransferase YrrM